MKFSCTFQATGTTWQIEGDMVDSADSNYSIVAGHEAYTFNVEELSATIKQRIEKFESTYSRFRPNSLVTQISKTSGSYTFPEDAQELFALYRKMYEVTDGLVTPLIGRVISDAGYDAKYSLTPKIDIASAKKWDEVMEYKYPILTTREPVMLDFGAIGKGYAIDIVGRLLQEKGFTNYTVNAGGDILHRAIGETSDTQKAQKPIRIGLEHPNNAKQVVGVAEICNKSICGSAGNRRAWGDYHHIINPDTVTSPKHISAVWVVVDGVEGSRTDVTASSLNYSTAIADALTTALFFVEPEVLVKRLVDGSKTDFKFEYLIVYADNTMRKSENFPAKMF